MQNDNDFMLAGFCLVVRGGAAVDVHACRHFSSSNLASDWVISALAFANVKFDPKGQVQPAAISGESGGGFHLMRASRGADVFAVPQAKVLLN